MAWITDSLRSAIGSAARLNPFARFGASTSAPAVFNHQLALAAYMSSGMMKKVISIPAADRTQKWRDWQAPKEVIAQIEREEKRLGLRAKVKQAEVLRGVGGGAILIITAGSHEQPLTPAQIAQGSIIALNVVSRWEIQGRDWVRNLADPLNGQPRMFEIQAETGTQKIHPSRVICFRGEPLPAGSAAGDEEKFWGDSRLLRVFCEVQRSDETQAWFSQLVKKAKLLRIGIPNLTDYTATTEGQQALASRVALIAEGESTLNATVFAAASGQDSPGETITDYQITWNGIPAVMDAFNQQVAAVSDIPFTRLMGRSPAGMNATGEHDNDNWNDAVSDGQENEVRPCLEALDPFLLRSAGVAKPDDVTWRWAPLWTPTEKQEAETFDKFMDGFTKMRELQAVPEQPFNIAFQNWVEEREIMPGLGTELDKLRPEERYGIQQGTGADNSTDPSELTQSGNGEEGGDPTSAGAPSGEDGSRTARRRAANDAAPRTLYVSRKVQNVADLKAWAKAQGLPALDDDLHVTIAYSTTPVDWIAMGSDYRDFNGKGTGEMVVTPGGPRVVEPLGNRTAVLMFASSDLSWRNREMREAGASWDFPDYQPHISLTGEPVDLTSVEPYRGKIVLGPEVFEEIKAGAE